MRCIRRLEMVGWQTSGREGVGGQDKEPIMTLLVYAAEPGMQCPARAMMLHTWHEGVMMMLERKTEQLRRLLGVKAKAGARKMKCRGKASPISATYTHGAVAAC